MKKLAFVLLTLAAFNASAVKITLTDPSEVITGDTKLCIYEGHGTEEVYEVAKSQNCPYAKTFETDE
jgi:hypothetical protein